MVPFGGTRDHKSTSPIIVDIDYDTYPNVASESAVLRYLRAGGPDDGTTGNAPGRVTRFTGPTGSW